MFVVVLKVKESNFLSESETTTTTTETSMKGFFSATAE